eukprot:Skav226452  [mRNA]  locus=scaffold3855:169188:169556:- [translate_table: standard]
MPDRYDVEGLDLEWDQSDSVRTRLRSGKTLTVVPNEGTVKADATIAECVCNADVLVPCLHRLLPAKLKLPDINNLREVIQNTYDKSSRETTVDQVDDDAWEIRKLIRFTKRKAKRRDPSTET